MRTMIPGKKHSLGGADYIVPPLCLGDVETYYDSLAGYNTLQFREQVALVIDITTLALQRNYPEMTRDVVKGLIGLENMALLFESVMNVTGLVEKEGLSGEAEAGSLLASTNSTAT